MVEALTQDAPLGFEQPAQEDIGLFVKDATSPTIPPNATEMAAQAAMADDTQAEAPFEKRYSDSYRVINTQGVGAVLEQVANQERAEQASALRAHAEKVAANGNPVTLENAARLITAFQEKNLQRASNLEGIKATSERALEMSGFQFATSRYKSMEAFDQQVQQDAESVSIRNLVALKSSELEFTTSLWDKVSHFFGGIFLSPVYEIKAQQAIARITQDHGIPNPLNSIASIEDLRTFFNGLNLEERQAVIKQLAKEELGIFGSNREANITVLSQLANMSRKDAAMDTIFNSLSIADGVGIGTLLAKAVRRGTPLRALNSAAGEEAAAKVAVSDLVGGTKIGGLNDEELMARMLSIGKNPMDIDPAAFAGMAAPAQKELRAAWDTMLENTRDRLISSGLTRDEIAAGLADVKARYSVETNKAIHSVVFGEGDELGQKMTVFWQGPDGRSFASKEAAEAWAKAEGKLEYAVVPKNASEGRFAAEGWDVAETAAEAAPTGNMLKTTDNKRLGSVLDQVVQYGGGDPLTQHVADAFLAASKKGETSVSGKQLLEIVALQSSDADMRFLARHLLNTDGKGVKWSKVPVELHWDLGPRLGDYDPAKDLVRIALRDGGSPETIVHELMHAHNAQVITLVSSPKKLAKATLARPQVEAAEQVIDLHKRLKQWHRAQLGKEAEKHGSHVQEMGDITVNQALKGALEHPAELLTYGLTKPAVRDVLKNIKLSDLGYAHDDRNVFSALWTMFKNILGLRADDTALAKLTASYENLAKSVDEGGRSVLSGMVERGQLGKRDVADLMKVGGFASKSSGKGKKKAAAKTPPPPAGPTEEWLVQERRVDPISNANIGKFSEQDIRSMPWLAIDPKHAASELAVEERVIGVHAEAKTRKDLVAFLQPSFTKLDNKGKRRVMTTLTEGDSVSNAGGQVGKEFTFPELMAKGLSEDEAAAYFAARQVRMVSYHMRNGEMVRALRADGYKEVELLKLGEKHAGKVFERDQANQVLGTSAYDMVRGEQVLVDSAVLDDAYAAGKKVVQLRTPYEIKGKHYFTTLVDDTTAKVRDIRTALNYRPGEFSRIYTDQYFITTRKMMEVDGKLQEIKETVRTAASAREAQEYVEAHRKAITMLLDSRTAGVPRNLEAQVEKLIGKYSDPKEFIARFNKGELDGWTGMDFHYTRNKEEFLNGSISEAMTNGRLFTSKRSDRLFSVDKDRVNIEDVYKSLEAEITNISRVANISQWRESMVRRWMNSFGDMIPNRTGNDVADFFSAAGATFTKGGPETLFAERTHKYIVRQVGVRTQEERYWEQLTRSITEKLFTGSEPIESVGAKIRTMSWLGFIRNVNFHMNLGMFNPAQLLVQANGAVTAMVLSPLHGLAAAKTFPLLRMALMSDNPDVWRKLARADKLTSLGLSSEDEFVKLVKAIRTTGIIDNMKSTSLYNLEDGALNVFGGYPSRVARSDTMFFNRGEEFSRVVSFDVARREWAATHGGADWTSRSALKDIVVRMDDLTQNMTKANLARWQEGLWTIPLQFAQYNIKLAANIMSSFMTSGSGRGFTKMEASKLLAGHVMVYGAAGNGLMWAVEEVLGNETKDKLSPATKNLIAQGMVSWAFDQVSRLTTGEGAKVALGSRLGSFDYYQKIGSAMFTDQTKLYDALLGPTVSAAKRIGVIGEVAQLWWKDPELSGKDVLDGLVQIGTEQVASLRNMTKAYLYLNHQGKMLDRNGMAIGKLNNTEMLMQAVGFAPTVSVDVHNMIASKKDHAQAMDDIANLVLRTQVKIVTALNRGDEAEAANQKKLLQALWPTNAGDFMDVEKRVKERLFPNETEFQKLLGEYLLKGQTYNKPIIVTEEPRKPF